jgi:hypothetical protein
MKYFRLITTAVITVVAVFVLPAAAVPARADPGAGSCPLAIAFLCGLVPIAPDLDHDVDLTKVPPGVNPVELYQDSDPAACGKPC